MNDYIQVNFTFEPINEIEIDILDAQSYSVNINNSRRELSQNDRFVDVMYENFLEWKNKALEILSTTINLISDEKAFYNFLKTFLILIFLLKYYLSLAVEQLFRQSKRSWHLP